MPYCFCPAFACSINNTPKSADASHQVLAELATPAQGQAEEHRDAAILLSLPGLGRKVGATILNEASRAIADRDYHALRCYSLRLPLPIKKRVVLIRHGCNLRLRNALYHWSRTSIVCDPKSKNIYAQVRARGPPRAALCAAWLTVGSRSSFSCCATEPSTTSPVGPLAPDISSAPWRAVESLLVHR